MTDRKRTISGPGAADVITAGGGDDLPGTNQTKGMGQTRDEADLTNAKNLIPRAGPDTEARPGERTPAEGNRGDETPGSVTGTIGGGGPDAHNPSPVRATGVDDESVVEGERPGE